MPRKTKQDGEFGGVSHVCLIMDESGSMGHLTHQGAALIEEQLSSAKNAKGDVRFTLSYFGTQYGREGVKIIADAVDPKTAEVHGRYLPNGGTPLHDAVGRTLEHLKSKVKKQDRSLVVIFTDGYENMSVDWDERKVAALIGKLQKKGNWTFTYASAGLDDWQARRQAQGMGIPAVNTVSSPVASGAVMDSVSHSYAHTTSAYLSNTSSAPDISHESKKAQEDLDKAAKVKTS